MSGRFALFVLAGKRRLGSLLPCDVKLIGSQFFAPFGFAFLFEILCHDRFPFPIIPSVGVEPSKESLACPGIAALFVSCGPGGKCERWAQQVAIRGEKKFAASEVLIGEASCSPASNG